jgi:hypothetical protein
MTSEPGRLTRQERWALREMEAALSKDDPRLARVLAGWPRPPLLLRISSAALFTVGMLVLLIALFTGQGLAFVVGAACVAVAIVKRQKSRRTDPGSDPSTTSTS